MKYGRSILAPVMVLAIALVTGGWFLQQGVQSSGGNVYMQTRLFQEVLDRVENTFVDPVDRTKMYDDAIDGLLDGLRTPRSSTPRPGRTSVSAPAPTPSTEGSDSRSCGRTASSPSSIRFPVAPRSAWASARVT